jgi:hypothetical protein
MMDDPLDGPITVKKLRKLLAKLENVDMGTIWCSCPVTLRATVSTG